MFSHLADGEIEAQSESMMCSSYTANQAVVGWDQQCPRSQGMLSVYSLGLPFGRKG